MEKFKSDCPNCGMKMKIQQMKCESCNLSLEGNVSLPRLARMEPEDREFIEVFVLSRGSIKEVEKALGISYPTVRSKLNKVIENLQKMNEEDQSRRMSILDQLEKGEITAADAVNLLKEND
jgi:hypothetical protein